MRFNPVALIATLSLAISWHLFAYAGDLSPSVLPNPSSCSALLKSSDDLVLLRDVTPQLLKQDQSAQDKGYKKLDSVLTFRWTSSRNIFGFSQPTEAGIRSILHEIGSDPGAARRTLFVDFREEPVLFIDGQTYNFRLKELVDSNLSLTGISAADLDALESKLKEELIRFANRNGGKIVIANLERDLTESGRVASINAATVHTTREVFEKIQAEGYAVRFYRIPITDQHAPEISDMSALLSALKAEEGSAQAFHCHYGHGRTTTGMVVAALFEKSKISGLKPSLSEEARQVNELHTVKRMIAALRMDARDLAILDAAMVDASVVLDLRKDLLSKVGGLADAAKRKLALQRYFMVMAAAKYLRAHESALSFSQWISKYPAAIELISNP